MSDWAEPPPPFEVKVLVLFSKSSSEKGPVFKAYGAQPFVSLPHRASALKLLSLFRNLDYFVLEQTQLFDARVCTNKSDPSLCLSVGAANETGSSQAISVQHRGSIK